MSSELANRFVHVIFEPDLDDWSRWAMGPGDLRPEVVALPVLAARTVASYQPTHELTVLAYSRVAMDRTRSGMARVLPRVVRNSRNLPLS
jgi:hypothetical protein